MTVNQQEQEISIDKNTPNSKAGAAKALGAAPRTVKLSPPPINRPNR